MPEKIMVVEQSLKVQKFRCMQTCSEITVALVSEVRRGRQKANHAGSSHFIKTSDHLYNG